MCLQAWGATKNPQLTNHVYKICTARLTLLVRPGPRRAGLAGGVMGYGQQ